MSKRTAIVRYSNNNSSATSMLQNQIPNPADPTKPRRKSLRSKISDKFNKNFHLFPNLPPEIRRMIWEFALPAGRVHELHPCTKLVENGKMMFRSNHSTPPTLLSTCQESRDVTLEHYQLMVYDAPSNTKGIRKFYYNPRADTLFLNTLMGLYTAFMLMEHTFDSESPLGSGTMKGWQNIAFDADRAHLLDLLTGHHGHPSSPRLKAVFPDLKRFTIAFDFTSKGKTRFRTSVWPGENGTRLKGLHGNTECLERLFEPILQFTLMEYGRGAWASEAGDSKDQKDFPMLELANVRRKRFLRGDIRYGFRKACAILRIKPPTILMRL